MKWILTNGKAKLVWNGDNRPEISDSSIRRLKVFQETYYYDCSFCGSKKVCPVRGVVCEDCLHNEEYQKSLPEIKEKAIRTKDYKEAVAFGTDTSTGKPLAVDRNGRKFSPKDSVYSKTGFDKDPFGWLATGKRVKDKEYGKQK